MNNKELSVMPKKVFVESIKALNKQSDHDRKSAVLLEKVFTDFGGWYNNDALHSQLIKVLKLSMDDNDDHSWIEYFIYELDYGKKYYEGIASRKDGSDIDLSSASKLYDFLLEDM